ncbi:MAG TPA: glycosyl transferase family 1 [Alphaproteobacteria bacterium]|nr:glycosyl transferase family 1 [Alphaproteobacteria bacterium]
MEPSDTAYKPTQASLVVGVDASRSRSGGAIAHVLGFLRCGDPRAHGIKTVHLWAHDKLLDAVEKAPWLVLHEVPASRRSIIHQLMWQRRTLPKLAKELGVLAMFNTDAGSVCPFQPSITLSQDMLSYEPGEMQRYPWPSRARIRLEALRFVQLHRLRSSSVAVFLTRHAAKVIGALTPLRKSAIIAHGIDEKFSRVAMTDRYFPASGPIRALYVSNAAPYKHQWHVVDAVARVRQTSGIDLRLRLVGGGQGHAQERLDAAIRQYDPSGQFVEHIAFVPHDRIAGELKDADLFVFASSCENLPITLLEAMAAGLPIATSNRGPMPEVMGPDACYFDPEAPESIATALSKVLSSSGLRQRIMQDARVRAAGYTWERCSNETWALLADVAKSSNH